MQIPATQALIFLPFVLPICFHVAFTDLRAMRITNQAVVALALVFVVIGPFVMPLPDYGWRWVHMIAALVLGMVLNAGGAMGAGDAKFIAAAAPFIAPGDVSVIVKLLAAVILAAVVTHRGARLTPLRRICPEWLSWEQKGDFPMGLALGGTLAFYIVLGAIYGA
ncbi:prepilin peptidase [Marinibacterium sp. SX1]|uniref:prepilin peptidase n=1 Tax=Marinibacterium sp. SX1 TaxID=3388424 RepID=UPI003D16E475